jgi:hypothetical protein
MKHINTFSNFIINEDYSEASKLPDSALDKLLEVMNKNAKIAIRVYIAFSKNPSLISQLQNYQNKINGSDLESIIATHIEKDPSEIALLDGYPELKNRIIKAANVEDFSKVGRLKNMGLI